MIGDYAGLHMHVTVVYILIPIVGMMFRLGANADWCVGKKTKSPTNELSSNPLQLGHALGAQIPLALRATSLP